MDSGAAHLRGSAQARELPSSLQISQDAEDAADEG
jgi:hypothetical protein